MRQKLFFVLVSSLILGGCTLLPNSLKNQEPNTDVQSPQPTTPSNIEEDKNFETSQATSPNDDVASLDADIKNTVIEPEDFSDLNQ